MVKKLIIINLFFFVTFLSQSQNILGCGCFFMPNEPLSQTVNNYFKNADAVFSGKVIEIGYRKMTESEISNKAKTNPTFFAGKTGFEILVIKFVIYRWWKGFKEKQIALLTDTLKSSDGYGTTTSCEVGFNVGTEFLVFAKGADKSHLQTHSCSGTVYLKNRSDFLQILGEGKPPQKWYSF